MSLASLHPANVIPHEFDRTVTFAADEGGQKAACLLRWVSATGEPGPWSSTFEATVAA